MTDDIAPEGETPEEPGPPGLLPRDLLPEDRAPRDSRATSSPDSASSDNSSDIKPPDIRPLIEVMRGSMAVQSLALSGLLLLGIFYTLYFARTFFLPVVLAILLSLLLSPAVRFLERLHLPRALAAALTLLILMGVVTGVVYPVIEPAKAWIAEAPRKLQKVERKLRQLREPVEDVSRAAERVGELTRVGDAPKKPLEVREKSATRTLLSGGQHVLASSAVIGILLFFLLSAEDLFLRKLVRMLPKLKDRKKAVWIARRIERDISTHLFTITVINLALGVFVAGALHLLNMPNPLLWGVMAACLNFVPYLGALVGTAVLTMASLLTFDAVGPALLVPAAYLFLTAVEGGLVTPMILGRRLSLNPVAVFLGLFFWGWLWGIPGVLLAVPIMASVKIFCDQVEILAPVGELLGR